jgi:PAS domain S-box-containing protein
MAKVTILVVEDEFITGSDIQNFLRESGYDVPFVVDNGEDAIRKAGELHPDLVLMDITLIGEMTGIEAAAQIRDRYSIPVIFLSAHSDDTTITRALKSEPFGYIIKPFEARDLKIRIDIALYKHAMDEALKERESTINALLNTIPDALVLLDNENKIVAVNETMAHQLQKSRDALKGLDITDLPLTNTTGGIQQLIDDLHVQNRAVYGEEKHGDRWYEISMFPMQGADGRITRIAIQSHDITGRKRFEEQLKKEGITQIERNMEQFQILNDQIRNPLQAILGYLQLGDPVYFPKIIHQVREIDDLVTRLDKGWMESEKVRSFLLRHYHHGAGTVHIPDENRTAGGRS